MRKFQNYGTKNNLVHGVAFGKLYLAGEYAILEDYSKALLTSVPQKIVTTVEPSEKLRFLIHYIILPLIFMKIIRTLL